MPLDHYVTPISAVQAILPYLPRAHTAFDPAAGTGELLQQCGAENRIGFEIDIELAEQHGWTHTNSLEHDWPDADLLIANPPFCLANEFASKAIAWRPQRSTVAMLLRLTFLESISRRQLHRDDPSDVYVLSSRPRFRNDTSGTDSVTSAWFVWGPGRGGRWSVL